MQRVPMPEGENEQVSDIQPVATPTAPQQPAPQPALAPAAPQVLSEEARAQILNTEIAKYAKKGWNVQSASAGMAVLSKTKRIGWFWNTVLTIVTLGAWLIYVIYRLANRKSNTMVLRVDAYGKVSKQ